MPHGSVLIRKIRLRGGGLGIYNFQHGGFAIRVTQRREPQAFGGKFGRAAETSEFVERGFRLCVQRLDFGKQFALRKRKLAPRLRTAQLGLLDPALRGAPVPNGNIQSGRSRGAEIRNLLAVYNGIRSKLWCINAVPIVDGQRRQIAGARTSDIPSRFADRSQRRTNIRIIARGQLLNFPKSWQRRNGMKIVRYFVVIVEVRKNQHGQIESRIEQSELCLLQLTAAFLRLQFCFDGIRMGHFPAVFEILREFQESVAFTGCLLRSLELLLTRSYGVVALNNCYNQTARSDFRARSCGGGGKRGASKTGNPGKI